jgi:hypothetical protein
VPAFGAVLSRQTPALDGSGLDGLSLALGLCLIALTVLSVQTALGLVFDPRYRDLPFAPQSSAVVPFLVLALVTPRRFGTRAMAESVAAMLLALSAIYIAFNETFANWQAIWLCVGLLALAVILERARAAPG